MSKIFANAGIAAAKVGGEHPAMDVQANRVLGILMGLSAQHVRTGNLQSSFRMGRTKGLRGVTDRIITSSDPAILSIEYGSYRVDGDGNRTTRRSEGLYLFARAANMAAAGAPSRFQPKRGDT